MKNLFLGIGSMLSVASLLFSQNMSVGEGWQIKGTETGFSSMEAFKKDCIDIVWGFDRKTQTWKGFSTNKEIQSIIESNPNFSKLDKIAPDEGFWVKANQDCLIKKEGGSKIGAASIVPYSFAQLWANTQPFTKEMLTNKKFKVAPDASISFDDKGFSTIDFDLGYGSSWVVTDIQCNTVERNVTLDSNGNLVSSTKDKYINTETNESIYETNTEKFRILAKDESIGYILLSEHGIVVPFIFDTAVETPIDMSTKLPYDVFMDWDMQNRGEILFNSDGTMKKFSTDENSYTNDRNFTIEEGKIVIRHDYNGTYDEYHSIDKSQIVFSMGDYDILKENYSGYSKDYRVSFNDENGSWQSIDLNSSIKTWYDIFKLTNNHLYDDEYDLENGTYGKSLCTAHHFTISSDGKELTTCWNENSQSCNKRTLENGAIVSKYNHTWYEVVKRTPYIQIQNCNASNPN